MSVALPNSAANSTGPHDGALRERSRWWYVLAAVTMGLGLVLYVALRFDDQRKAKICLYIGIATILVYGGPTIIAIGGYAAAGFPDYSGW